MAIERDVGPGGALEQQAAEQAEVLIENALGQNPGVFNFDDGSAIVGEYTEMEATVEAAFDSNLAEFMEEGDLNQISNDLIGNIDDDFASRQGLLKMIGKRKRLLSYVKDKNVQRYQDLVKKIGIRG